MTRTNAAGVAGICMVIGWGLGLLTNGEIYYWAGKMSERAEARKEARQWAEDELKHHCVSWHTDRRRNDYMACLKPEWMR